LAGAYVKQIGQFLAHQLTPVIHDLKTLRSFEAALKSGAANLAVHIEIDSGMGRTGFLPAEIDFWRPEMQKLKALRIEGVFSHFSDAETLNEAYSEGQLQTFASVIAALRNAGINPDLVHMAKSAALLTTPHSHFSMVRPGLALYGIYPSPLLSEQIALKPVLSWTTRILQLKRVPAGTCLGYGRTFVTKRESLIATLPVGYADGYRRLFSNRAAVLVRGCRAPVAGRVSMDLTTIDVTDIAKVQQGDEVTLLGRQGDVKISADEMACWADTISYEILTSIGTRVPRIHINSQED
ncbi:MAG TPA: alanine racemase, partial [Candidatus Acidoferrales bacterium]|nr:alanine racemase [Candidatus Acidoferrales bacterium]